MRHPLLLSLVFFFALAHSPRAEEPVRPIADLDPRLLVNFKPRPLGPANMSGRIVGVAVDESRRDTLYVASATGGLWKTTNRGTTWQPLFTDQAVVALGDVAVAPSEPNTVWVGTGEANPRNSVSWGDGVYKSTDGGQTWRNTGLRDSRHVGRIVVHPKKSDVVYVAALGHVWGPSEERGVFKTVDGGGSWQRVLHFDADTGAIDLVIDPSNPETLYAALYVVRRGPFSGGNPARQFGPHAGLYKTTDGGASWKRLTRGLPDRFLGRCGLAVWRKDPRVVYAVVQTDRTDIREVAGQPPRGSRDPENGGIFRSDDHGETWTKVNDLCPRPFYYGQIRVDPNDAERVYVLGVSFFVSSNGGRTFRADPAAAAQVHSDHHALWIDPTDSRHLVLGNDGGLYFSQDRGVNWEHLKNLPLAQFYAVGVDDRRPYHVYGGLQDNGSWTGPSATRLREGIGLGQWTRLLEYDGFYCAIEPTDPNVVYVEGQYGRLRRIHLTTGESTDIRPREASGVAAYRFNWSSPIFISPHQPRALYYAGNHVFRSADRGATWQVVSPDLSHGKPGPSLDSGHTITTLAESPVRGALFWAGTDDGRVHVHRPNGDWVDVGTRLPGVPPTRWITRVEPSHFAPGTAYVALSRHRHDDPAPYLFRTTDYGETWTPRMGNLPLGGPVHVVRESSRNPNLLFAGTEFGLFASADAGDSWHPLRNGLPTVPVHDLVIHPRERELVVATHGRGMWVVDVGPLEELSPAVLARRAHLFAVRPAVRFEYRTGPRLTGGRFYTAPNPDFGAAVWLHLKEMPPTGSRLTVRDAEGDRVAELPLPMSAGLHRLVWDLRLAGSGAGRRTTRPLVPTGNYAVRLELADEVLEKPIRVVAGE